MVTGATYLKTPVFVTSEHLHIQRECALSTLEEDGWNVHAYVFFANHYHVLIHKEQGNEEVGKTIGKIHRRSATAANKMDKTQGRKVWHQYWETEITNERAYLARIKYIHENPVWHGIVSSARLYEWSSLSWFEQTVPKSFLETVEGFNIDRVKVKDDF